ncbi:tail assembly protein [Acinetobacter pollinis]|uniref:tail assembly protein n=1 Tax=Acinetobacter pollinis TaxID=2605270 RepID=UPI0018C23DF8|nr:tail assembly protein [Acinetobacter pollinis]MBF7694303.1 tail assembly protein [Acinetobacter pollinis]MBF7701890.1 tail assembly protein [Acinetobacter pollinis]
MSFKTIRFHGVLREQFGKEWRLQVNSVQEGMRLLAVQIEGLEQFFLNAHQKGLRFAIFIDHRTTISEQELDMQNNAELIRIVPIVEGAGGALQTVLGAIMIGVGVFTFGTGTAVGMALIGAGAGMAIGGVTSMLMPKANTSDANDSNKSNYGFGSAVTTVAQGNPVPILYGQREVGGFIISAGQYPEDML